MKSPSSSLPEATRRAGFTIAEALLAFALGLVVVAMSLNAYLGADSTVTRTVGDSQLKQAGEDALGAMYRDLKGVKRIFVRGASAASWIARTNLTPYDAGGLTPAYEAPDNVLPDLLATASFDAASVGLTAATGNTLFFVSSEPAVVITEPAASPASGPHTTVFGTPKRRFSVYRFRLYHLAKKPLAAAEPLVRGTERGTDGYTYRLMKWQSRPYLDYHEVRAWIAALKTYRPALSPDPTPFITDKLAALSAGGPPKVPYAGAVDLAVADGAIGASPPGLYELSLAGEDLAPSTARLVHADYRAAVAFGLQEGFGLPMVAFNNGTAAAPPPVPARDVGQGASLRVPGFAAADEARPFGFEVLVGGPVSDRQVLLRLALAVRDARARTSIKGLIVQQSVRVYER